MSDGRRLRAAPTHPRLPKQEAERENGHGSRCPSHSTWVAAVATAGDIALRRTVDLDAPGVMERVRVANPAHFDKIVRIVEGVVRRRIPLFRGGCG
jgi:hypothetical protein